MTDYSELILEELCGQGFVTGETIYVNIAEKLSERCTEGFCREIRDDLDILSENGTIARYKLCHPKNRNIEKFVNESCDELVYLLIRKD